MSKELKQNPASESTEVIEPDEILDEVEVIDDMEAYDALAPLDLTLDILPAEDLSAEKILKDDSDPDDKEEESAAKLSKSKDLVRHDPLQSYLQEIRNTPLLSREEEHELAVRYHVHGDKAAGYKLVVSNLRLVVLIAREHQRNVQNMLDLVQEGNIGLLEAVKKYDPFRGIRFPSYAVYWIRAYILRYLINNIRLVKVGTTQAQRKLFFNLVKEREKLEKEGFVPEAKLLAERLNVKETEVLEMEQRLALPEVSVDQPLRGNEDQGDMHGLLSDERESQEDTLVRSQFHGALREAVESFKINADEKEIAIIEQRLLADEPVTLQTIAEQFSVSRERIRQIEARLKERLKKYLQEKLELEADGDVRLSPPDE